MQNPISEYCRKINKYQNIPARWTTQAIFCGGTNLGVRKATLTLWLSGGNALKSWSSQGVLKTPSLKQAFLVSQTVFQMGFTIVGGQFWPSTSGNSCLIILSSNSSFVPPHPLEKNSGLIFVLCMNAPYTWSNT